MLLPCSSIFSVGSSIYHLARFLFLSLPIIERGFGFRVNTTLSMADVFSDGILKSCVKEAMEAFIEEKVSDADADSIIDYTVGLTSDPNNVDDGVIASIGMRAPSPNLENIMTQKDVANFVNYVTTYIYEHTY